MTNPDPKKLASDVAIAAPITPNIFNAYQVAITFRIATDRYVNARNLFSFCAIIIFRQKLWIKGMVFGIIHKMAIQ